MLKLLGSILIISATTLTGFYMAWRLGERTKQLRQLQMCLQMLETEIYYGSTPLAVAFRRLGQQDRGVVPALFARCAYYLEHLDGQTTWTCWQRALTEAEGELALRSVEKEWLEHFGKVVGGSDREDQHKHLRLMLAQFGKAEKEAEAEQAKHEKMYKTLGVLSGLMIVILML
ncbi:stage III sporulation protein AB [Caldalkalibacillus uzonensis]|uniref:Stage III sporulation protein AB n=1 Tax=Caldalkalibacillus uzonensis TaxID=353224 RepID=A0ABU0CMU0_9BACI|nr:stage III sporulation protein SpoIIIAB [Caldalkalibacillus uzonensis]MDQ0337738.1 stage III sporulation protein AB [Caldalkalibacillus uzonensis]